MYIIPEIINLKFVYTNQGQYKYLVKLLKIPTLIVICVNSFYSLYYKKKNNNVNDLLRNLTID